MPTGSFDQMVVKAHEGKTAGQLIGLDVDVLDGVSAGDMQHLEDAFGITTVGQLATNRFFRAARAIQEEAADIAHDPGPCADWSEFLASAPLATYQANPTEFRLDFGPIYYRGRLDGTARVLVIGQDPAANELIGHRAFVGASGQRLQGFLRRLGIERDYIMVNTYLYPVFGQFTGTLATLSREPSILGFRNEFLDRLADKNAIEAIVTVGRAARDAVERWPAAAPYHVQHITHPSAHDHAALLANWNQGLAALRPIVQPEVGVTINTMDYGTDFTPDDHDPIPRRDLPFGVPEWHGDGSRARRGRLGNGKTNHKEIIWEAP